MYGSVNFLVFSLESILGIPRSHMDRRACAHRPSNTYIEYRMLRIIARTCVEKWGAVFLIRYGIINAKEHFNGNGLFNGVNGSRAINSL